MYLNIIKALYDKLTANLILIDERLRVISLRLGTDKGAHSHHFYST